MPKPTPDQIRKAGRQLQRGGLLGRGSSKKADQLVRDAEEAGLDGRDVAFQILGAAADYEPRPWAR
ncbi:hypothetical protein ACIHCX_03350 [Streptomyces sp. NPDC052043]|uniref:hypothetical protein n=1 Tax=Streptomyces sp. NPDC052043 TaxID=3365684 RepID=UPI0037D1D312